MGLIACSECLPKCPLMLHSSFKDKNDNISGWGIFVSAQGVNRRTFVAGLGAASLACWPRTALAQAAPRTAGPFDDIRVRIIDTAFDLTRRAQAIRQAGITTVIRYYAHGTG